MRKVILRMHLSIDGYVQAETGTVLDWVYRSFDDELRAWEVDTLWEAGMHIMGKSTYAEMAAHWPVSTEVFAPPMNDTPKVVFSRTLQQVNWNNTTIASGELIEEVTRLKKQCRKDILAHGGVRFAQALARVGLVDEYRLIVHPVVFGTGKPLFNGLMDLQLIETRAFPAGAVLLRYSST